MDSNKRLQLIMFFLFSRFFRVLINLRLCLSATHYTRVRTRKLWNRKTTFSLKVYNYSSMNRRQNDWLFNNIKTSKYYGNPVFQFHSFLVLTVSCLKGTKKNKFYCNQGRTGGTTRSNYCSPTVLCLNKNISRD